MKHTLHFLLVFLSYTGYAQDQVPEFNSGMGGGALFSFDPRVPVPARDALTPGLPPALRLLHQRHYWSSELASAYLISQSSFNRSVCSFLIGRTGYAVSNTTCLSGSYAMALTGQWSVGATAGYTRTRLGEQARDAFSSGISTHYMLSPAMVLGSSFRYSGAVSARLGLRMVISDHTSAYAESGVNRNGATWHAGLQYMPDSAWAATLGFRSFPARPSFGVRIAYKHLLLGVSTEYHPDLGFNPSASLVVVWKKN